MDFRFVKEFVGCFSNNRRNGLREIVVEYTARRGEYLNEIENSLKAAGFYTAQIENELKNARQLNTIANIIS